MANHVSTAGRSRHSQAGQPTGMSPRNGKAPNYLTQGLFIVTLSNSEGSRVLSVPTILVPEDFRFFASGSE